VDRKTINLIKKSLRSATMKWSIKNEVLKQSRVFVKVGYYKNGKVKTKRYYACALCGGFFDKIQIDHKNEVGKFTGSWDEYISSLFCPIENLQALCEECHKVKTKEYNIMRSVIDGL